MTRANDVIGEWLAEGEAGEADWATVVLRLANRGDLGHAGRLLLDLPALAQPYACRSAECTPGRRAAGTRSCCADLDVALTVRERAAVEEALPRLARHLRPLDGRWAAGAPPVFVAADEPVLRRERGRCVFAVRDADGLRCGLRQLEVRERRRPGTLRPIPCRLFPLVLIDLGEGRRLLTAVHRRTAALVGSWPARRFPCLRGDEARPALHAAERATIEQLFGAAACRRIGAAVERWRQTPPNTDVRASDERAPGRSRGPEGRAATATGTAS
jgi:hypothetical protein